MAPSRQPDTPLQFEGFSSPNYTQIPNEFLDIIAPLHLSDSELRVGLYILRRTWGFGKDADAISFSQMIDGIRRQRPDGSWEALDYGTGLSRKGVWSGVNGLQTKGIIEVEKRRSVDGDNEINIYRVRMRAGVASPGNHPGFQGATRVVSPGNQGGLPKGGGVVSSGNHGGFPGSMGVVSPGKEHEERTQKKEQQQPTPSPAVDAGASITPNVVVASSKIGEETTRRGGESTLFDDLVALGVSANVARHLVNKYSEEVIQEQIAALAFRTRVKDPGAVLVQSIKESWAMPKPYVEAKTKAERATQSQAERDVADAALEAAQQARRDRQVKIDAYLAVLSESETEELTVAATRQVRESSGSFWANRAIPGVLLNATIRTLVAGRMGLGPEPR